jgi:hypothetical protein
MVADHGLNRVQAIGHKAFATGEATPSCWPVYKNGEKGQTYWTN